MSVRYTQLSRLADLPSDTRWIVLVKGQPTTYTGYEKNGEHPGYSECVELYGFSDLRDRDLILLRLSGEQKRVQGVRSKASYC